MRNMKCTTKDFTEADLPLTRKDMFFDCYKEQFSLILRVGLLCLLFLLPMLLVLFFRDMYIIGALKTLEEQTAENIQQVYMSANVVFGAMEAVASVIFFVLFSGIAQVLKQLCWGEPIFFGDDFKNGLKDNGWRFTVVGIVLSTVGYFVGLMCSSSLFFVVFVMYAAVFVPIGIWILLQSLYYRLPWTKAIKNAALYLVRTLPVTILLLACITLPFWLVTTFVSLIAVRYMLLAILAVFYAVPVALAWILYALKTFDECINKKYFPEMYRKGLRLIDESAKIADK